METKSKICEMAKKAAAGFLKAPKESRWVIFNDKDEKSILPYGSPLYNALTQRFQPIPEKEVSEVEIVELNDTAKTTRGEESLSAASLPALEVRFRDTKYPDVQYIVFVEGGENIIVFLSTFIAKFEELYPFEKAKEDSAKPD